MTNAEKVIKFIETYCRVPEGDLVGRPLELADFQKQFLTDLYDNPARTRRAILSMGRKNGKTALVSCILLAHIVGPMARQNSQVVSAALSREQAAIVFRHAVNMINMNEELAKGCKVTQSGKTIIGLYRNVEYRALAADGSTAMGLSPVLALFDETGQVKGTEGRGADFLAALISSQGAHSDAQQIFISTQAPTDADYLSQLIDDAMVSKDPKTVCHLYAADKGCDLLDEEQWKKANPALGTFRNLEDLKEQMMQASRLPSFESEARNLLLNQRVSLEGLAFAPQIVGENNGKSDWDAFRCGAPVHLGLDLGKVNDLTAAVICVDDGDHIHVKTFAFCPLEGIEERSAQNKIPLTDWVRDGVIHAPAGRTVDYGQVCQYLNMVFADKGIDIATVQFDDWNMREFRLAAERERFCDSASWVEVRQGYKSMSPRVSALETALLQKRLLLDNNPVMNMGLAAAIVRPDPAGNRKLVKPNQKGPKVDAVIALLQAVYPCLYQEESLGADLSYWIG